MLTAKQHRTPYIAVAVAVFLMELGLTASAVAGHWSGAAVAHLGVIAILTAWMIFSSECRTDLRLPLLLTVTTAFMGPIGGAGTIVVIVLTKRYAKTATSFEEWYFALFPEAEAHGQLDLWRGILVDEDNPDKSSVAPFSDILFFGTLAQKQELISLMSRSFQPVFAPILRTALGDSNNAIRVQAASAITVVEDDFLRRSLTMTASVRENPQDPPLLLKLARLNDEYASAGILDSGREQESCNRALETYREYLKLRPKDLEARTAIGRLLLREGKYDEARLWSSEIVDDSAPSSELLFIHMEALYHLRRFHELRHLATSYVGQVQSDHLSLEVAETLKLWANPA